MEQPVLSDRDRRGVVAFLARLARHPELARALARDVDRVLDTTGLSDASKALLKSGDQERIAAALGRVGIEV